MKPMTTFTDDDPDQPCNYCFVPAAEVFPPRKPTLLDRLLEKIDWRGTKKGGWFLLCAGLTIFVTGCFDIYNGAHTPAVMVLGLLLTGTASFRVFPRFHDWVHRKT